MEKVSIFPTSLWKFSITEPERVNEGLAKYIQSLKGDDESSISSLDPVKWHTTRMLHRKDKMQELNRFVVDSCRQVLQATKIENGENLVVTGAWGNVSGPGSSHHKHTHPNNYLSCVYYVATTAGCNTINFYDPREQVGLIRPKASERTIDNSSEAILVVKPGDLVVFPHWLRHNVSPNTSEVERISIAYNLMFRDFVEHMSAPMW